MPSWPKHPVFIPISKCPAFDCHDNRDFACTRRPTRDIDETVTERSPDQFVSPNCVKPCPVSSTRGRFVLDEQGKKYLFLSYVPGQGLHKGIFEGRNVELCAIKYNSNQLLNISFYHDKVLKWIPKNQMVLPGIDLGERMDVHE